MGCWAWDTQTNKQTNKEFSFQETEKTLGNKNFDISQEVINR